MKKLTAVLFVAASALLIAGCNNDTPKGTQTSTITQSPVTVTKTPTQTTKVSPTETKVVQPTDTVTAPTQTVTQTP